LALGEELSTYKKENISSSSLRRDFRRAVNSSKGSDKRRPKRIIFPLPYGLFELASKGLGLPPKSLQELAEIRVFVNI
jgi:hypothetical protein